MTKVPFKFNTLLIYLYIVLLVTPCAANAVQASFIAEINTVLPESKLVPGGIAIIRLPSNATSLNVKYNNKKVSLLRFNKQLIALAGIPLSAKAGEKHHFSVKNKNGDVTKTKISIQHKDFPEQRLTIINKRKVNPYAKDMKRIGSESIRKKQAKAYWSKSIPEFDFIWPVDGRISSTFGLRRFFNDQERKPHSGLDIAAIEGTPIKATLSGTVIEMGDFFFSGNMIYIDHGQGIISLYAHLSKINVQPGEKIEQGEIIGEVGQTGRVTGAHLHFAILANKTLIDPLYLLPIKK